MALKPGCTLNRMSREGSSKDPRAEGACHGKGQEE